MSRLRPKSRHSCPAFAALLGLTLAACTTTHQLGRIGDPATTTQVATVASRPGAVAEVTPLPGRLTLTPALGVLRADPAGLVVSVGGAPPATLPYTQLAALNTYDPLRGARDGALLVGIPAFVLGFAFTRLLVVPLRCCSTDNSETTPALKAGAVVRLAGAVVGAALGALAGHRDRYVIAPN